MIALVLSRARHLLSHSVFGSSLAGDGLLVRLRSTSIGLLGLVTAVGLGLIAFIAQLGWPGVFNAPIPGSPHEAGTVHNAVALTRSAPSFASSGVGRAARLGASGPARSRGASAGGASHAGAGLGGSRQLTTGDDGRAPASVGQPKPTRVPNPAPAPATPAPAPTQAPEPTSQPVATVPAVSPPAPQSSSVGARPKPSSVGGAITPKGEKDDAKLDEPRHPAAPKPPKYSQAKPDDENSAAPPAPPVASPPSKEAPEVKDDDGKRYGEWGIDKWGKSGGYHH